MWPILLPSSTREYRPSTPEQGLCDTTAIAITKKSINLSKGAKKGLSRSLQPDLGEY